MSIPSPPFDPTRGTVVAEPVGDGPGYWAGAPAVCRDLDTGDIYLYYRIRRPRNVEPERGGECRILRSEDGVHFEPVWSAVKSQFGSDSMERAALGRGPDGVWRLFLSYVDPDTKKWRVDRMEADRPDSFDPTTTECLFDPDDLGVEGVKDPVLFHHDGAHHMILSYATPLSDVEGGDGAMHATADAYNTGLVVSRTGLATSGNGRDYDWQGDLFSPETDGWDRWCRRICCVVPGPDGLTAYYDGAADVSENYEERTGIAVGPDLRSLTSATPDGPCLVSPHATGCLRYMDALILDDRVLYYYELARPDGAHETRVSVVPTG